MSVLRDKYRGFATDVTPRSFGTSWGGTLIGTQIDPTGAEGRLPQSIILLYLLNLEEVLGRWCCRYFNFYSTLLRVLSVEW